MELKAIETTYNGLRFRSRLEARWAVFMDYLGVKYDYEPEGYDLDGLLYLPDFYIKSLDAWVEIKPVPMDEKEYEKASRLALATDKTVYVFRGQIDVPTEPHVGGCAATMIQPGLILDGDGKEIANAYSDEPYYWCQCPVCYKFGIEFDGRADRICRHTPSQDKGYNANSSALVAAYTEARKARFEFGENRNAH